MDFYAQARLLTGMFSRWPDFQMNLYDHDAKLQPELNTVHAVLPGKSSNVSLRNPKRIDNHSFSELTTIYC